MIKSLTCFKIRITASYELEYLFADLNILHDGLVLPPVVVVVDGVVDPLVKHFCLELLHREAQSAPVIEGRVQIPRSAVDEHEILSLPVAAVLVTVYLAVHSQWTVRQPLLFSSALQRLGLGGTIG